MSVDRLHRELKGNIGKMFETVLAWFALNWVARQAGVASIIIGARTTAQLEDNLGAAGWSLSDAEIARLSEASAKPPIYPYDMHMSFMGDRNPAAPLLPALAEA